MPEHEERWSICPVEDCEYALEYDPNASAYCPECGMELVSECPDCKAPVLSETQTSCPSCGKSLKE
jgi:predicted RNA-binding Zn-ribbon protein involved in translation (DUF1610 family)